MKIKVFWFTCSNREILDSSFLPLLFYFAYLFIEVYLIIYHYTQEFPLFSFLDNNTIIFKGNTQCSSPTKFIRFIHLEQKKYCDELSQHEFFVGFYFYRIPILITRKENSKYLELFRIKILFVRKICCCCCCCCRD